MSKETKGCARSLQRLVSLRKLAGLYAHSVVNGKVEWQCMVKREDADHIVVVCFSWIDGRQNCEKRVRKTDTADWVFFASRADFIRATNANDETFCYEVEERLEVSVGDYLEAISARSGEGLMVITVCSGLEGKEWTTRTVWFARLLS